MFTNDEATPSPATADQQVSQDDDSPVLCCPDCGAEFTEDEAMQAMEDQQQQGDPNAPPMPSPDDTRNRLAARNTSAPPSRQLSDDDMDSTAQLVNSTRARMRANRSSRF